MNQDFSFEAETSLESLMERNGWDFGSSLLSGGSKGRSVVSTTVDEKIQKHALNIEKEDLLAGEEEDALLEAENAGDQESADADSREEEEDSEDDQDSENEEEMNEEEGDEEPEDIVNEKVCRQLLLPYNYTILTILLS